MAIGFYELSGGNDFDPQAARIAAIEARQDRDARRLAAIRDAVPPKPRPAEVVAAEVDDTEIQTEDVVTRTDLNLVSFSAAASKRPNQTRRIARSLPTNVGTAPDKTPLSELTQRIAAEPRALNLSAINRSASANTFAGTSSLATSDNVTTTLNIRRIKGTRVNMRSGPGTDYDVVDQLLQNTQVEVLTDTGTGWVELRTLEGGTTGWVASFLLTGG
ncbi:MAG: SH3 domain-containing protein [Pseudomonadota bacterium]